MMLIIPMSTAITDSRRVTFLPVVSTGLTSPKTEPAHVIIVVIIVFTVRYPGLIAETCHVIVDIRITVLTFNLSLSAILVTVSKSLGSSLSAISDPLHLWFTGNVPCFMVFAPIFAHWHLPI